MTSRTDSNLVGEYWTVLAREFPAVAPGRLIDIGNRLIVIARASHRLAEIACNQGLTAAQAARDARLDAEARALAEELGTTVALQGDPRGAPVRLLCPSGYSSGWGGGLVVPY